jgi:hypothetical protein
MNLVRLTIDKCLFICARACVLANRKLNGARTFTLNVKIATTFKAIMSLVKLHFQIVLKLHKILCLGKCCKHVRSLIHIFSLHYIMYGVSYIFTNKLHFTDHRLEYRWYSTPVVCAETLLVTSDHIVAND